MPPDKTDHTFYERADAHILMSNEQMKDAQKGQVSASMMFALSRFNAWVSATGWHSSEELARTRDETIEYFVQQYRFMLEENFDDYIQNFAKYMKAGGTDKP